MTIIPQKKFRLLSFAAFAFSFIQAQTISVHSITSLRNGNGMGGGYTLDGSWMASSARLKLLSPFNFGASGTYSKTISIVDGYGSTGSLSQVNTLPYSTIFFFGAFDKLDPGTQTFTSGEVDSLYNWSKRGGKMIICSGQVNPTPWGFSPYDSRVLNVKWGIFWANESPDYFIPTVSSSTMDIFNGPFGNITAAYQGGAIQGYFDPINNNTQVLATNNSGKPTLMMDCNTLDLIAADVDGYSSVGNITSGAAVVNDQDKFWTNTIAFMDRLQPPPVAYNNNNLLGLNATYVNYQWYYNNQLLNGATGPTYSISQTGVYYAEVTLNGGCKLRSDSLKVMSIAGTVGINEEIQEILKPVIYPNPFNTFTQIDFKQEVKDVTVIITDETGRELRSQEFSGRVFKVEKESLRKGLYLVNAVSEGKFIFNEKIIID